MYLEKRVVNLNEPSFPFISSAWHRGVVFPVMFNEAMKWSSDRLDWFASLLIVFPTLKFCLLIRKELSRVFLYPVSLQFSGEKVEEWTKRCMDKGRDRKVEKKLLEVWKVSNQALPTFLNHLSQPSLSLALFFASCNILHSVYYTSVIVNLLK